MTEKNRSKDRLSSLEALAQHAIKNALKDLHTMLPGIIDTFDPSTQTCKVQPAIKRIFTDGEEVELPVLINVPVSFPTAGDFSITFPIKKGDECIILFSERSLDNWLKFGDIRKPNDKRFHDLSDGLVLMGLRSNPNALSSYDPNNLVIRDETNDAKIIIGDDKKILLDSSVEVIVTAPNTKIDGTLNVTGAVTLDSELSVTGATTVADISADNVEASGDVTAGGISLTSHTHGYIGAGQGSSPQTTQPPG